MLSKTKVSSSSFRYPPPTVTFAFAPPATPWIKPSDLWKLINKAFLGLCSLCCACNCTALESYGGEGRKGDRESGAAQLWRREWIRLGAHGMSGRLKWDSSLLSAWHHSTSVPLQKRESRMTVCFKLAHSVAQTRWSLCFCSPTHTNKLTDTLDMHTHTCILYSSSSQRYKARIMMTGGGVMRLSSACSH